MNEIPPKLKKYLKYSHNLKNSQNTPKPKKLPKYTWNLIFTHRNLENYRNTPKIKKMKKKKLATWKWPKYP